MTQPRSTRHDDVVEWGTEEEVRRGSLAALTARLGIQDHHLVRIVAAAGAGLAGLSLLTHWQVTTVSGSPAPIETSVADLMAWGSGYLVGLLGLVALTVMTLYGAPVLRPHVRVAGLGWGAGLLGLLLALAATLTKKSVAIGGVFFGPEPDYEMAYGPGLFLAVAGVATLTAALHLSGRPGTGSKAGGAATEPDADIEPDADTEPDADRRPQRRPREGTAPVPHAGPIDLTVTPDKPFVHLPEHR